ncbi:hypothetical protein [Pseudolactococcus hodotermopsidis]|uniref:hypothetical protein n=1 Tax=Pseudolactococcus hodotermopsidis TaxID=2709157 RepID=UPI001552F14A|nr:hypothetical protein [Lactococcus hodotermopsidis]
MLDGKEQDVLVPSKVTFGRLKVLVTESLAENGFNLPSDYQLVIKGKSFEMGQFDLISDFALSNGDRLEILLGETSAII